MKLKNLILALLCICFFGATQAQTVQVSGRIILLNGNEYKIHGVCYSRGGAGSYQVDIPLMQEANINTIRVYSAITDEAELDAFSDAGIKVIMHLDENDFESYINQYKDHPAILFWQFGNEFNYHADWFNGDISNWYSQLEACAQTAHALDSNHPVSTAHGELPTTDVLNACPSVDIWGMNLYRWDDDTPALDALNDILSSGKAMYVSEAGADSYNKIDNVVNESDQATANSNILNGITAKYDICAGVTLFEFCDEWWKAGDETVQNPGGSAPNSSGVPYDGSADEEYWGIVTRARVKKATFDVVKDIYGNITDNAYISWKSYNISGKYIRHKASRGRIDSDVSPANDANWIMVSGLAGSGVSFQSVNYPTRYLRHRDGEIWLDENDGSTLFQEDATFMLRSGLTDNSNYSFESYNYPGHYIRHKNSLLYSEEISSELDRNDATFIKTGNGSLPGSFSTTIQAENYSSMYGVELETTSDTGGGQNVGYIETGDWMAYSSITIPTSGTYTVSFRVASESTGGQLSLDINAGASIVATVDIPATGGWQTWQTVSGTMTLDAGTYDFGIYAQSGGWNINWWQISSASQSTTARKSSNILDTETITYARIYPNPVNDILHLSSIDDDVAITIYDGYGKEILRSTMDSNGLDISAIKPGMYTAVFIHEAKVQKLNFIKK